MKAIISPEVVKKQDREFVNKVLRTCVHCGFCSATCPTYQLTGNENDSPRGRIYLIKQMLEGEKSTALTRHHLDRCLTCLNCETTCPSGVQYSKLIDIGRHTIEEQASRSFGDRAFRKSLRLILPYKNRFTPLFAIGRLFRPLLPQLLKKKIPKRVSKGKLPKNSHARTMLMLDGCVQPALSPDINAATARVLDKLGITLIQTKKAGCCGAVSQHLSAEKEAQVFIKHNIDAWWPEIEKGIEAIVMTASGCGTMVKDYAHLLQHDPDYAEKAKTVSHLCKDISEIIAQEDLSQTNIQTVADKISWHPPCTLQHGQKINGVVEKILTDIGYQLLPVKDKHLCCGSAGTYSLLQPKMSQQLQINKITNLLEGKPEMIATANIGCQTHLQEASDVPVIHWILLLDRGLS